MPRHQARASCCRHSHGQETSDHGTFVIRIVNQHSSFTVIIRNNQWHLPKISAVSIITKHEKAMTTAPNIPRCLRLGTSIDNECQLWNEMTGFVPLD